MTNNMIIFWESVKLMNEGKLKGTGRKVIMPTPAGFPVEVEVPETIHTFQAWKELGFSVKKGQKAVAAIQIWKHTSKKVDVEGKDPKTGEIVTETVDTSKMFRKVAYFFSASQVEKAKEKKTA